MGIFSKVACFFLSPMLTQAIQEGYNKFLVAPGEFNQEVLSCADVNYSINVVNEFLEKHKPQDFWSGDTEGFCHQFGFSFEDFTYNCYMFKHYARALTVSVTINTDADEHLLGNALALCNDVNLVDPIHQVGIIVDEKTHQLSFRVTRQFLFTPNIGTVETFEQGLRDFKAYALKVAGFNAPENGEWEQFANPQPTQPIETAEDFWFTKKGTVLKDFADTSKVINENEDNTIHLMINMMGNNILIGSQAFLAGQIITFKKFPYLAVMKTSVAEGDPMVGKIDVNKAFDFANTVNSHIHFAPLRVVLDRTPEGNARMNMIMSGFFADDCNTRTYADFLCTLQKETCIMWNVAVGKTK